MLKILPSMRIMRPAALTVYLICCTALSLVASAKSQVLEKEITIRIDKKNLKEAFDKISAKVAVPIIYSNSTELFRSIVSVQVRNKPLKQLLDNLLAPYPLTYQVIDEKIIISHQDKNTILAVPLKEAPKIPVKGKVTGGQGEPLPGATIRIKGDKNVTVTDTSGEFKLADVPLNVIIQISYIGYKTREITINGNVKYLNIVLETDAASLNEVIVSTGYQDIAPERATGSFVKVNNELLNRSVSTDVISRLENVTSGLLFDRRSGGAPKLDIRSRSTILANDQPLIVLDNFPYDGDINNINPNDVENITVLKDAAAASIWGVRAGNGVIVITTKKGKYNQPMKVDFNANLNLGQKPQLSKLPWISSSDYIDLEKTLFAQGYYDANAANTTNPTPFTPVVELLYAAKNGTISDASANTQIDAMKQHDVRKDIAKYLYRTSVNQQYALNLSGGSEKQKYYFSAGYDKNLDNIVGNGNNRLTLRAANTFKPVKDLELNTDLIYTQTQTRNNGLDYTSVSDGAGTAIYPYAQLADNDGNPLAIARDYRRSFVQTAQSSGLLNWQYVPLNEINISNNKSVLSDIRLNTSARYTLINALNAEVRYTYERSELNNRNLYSQDTYYTRNLINTYTSVNSNGSLNRPVPLGGILDQSYSIINSNAVRGQFNFDQSWKENRITAIAGMEVRQVEINGNGNRTYGFNDNILTYNSQINYSSQMPTYDGNFNYIPYSNTKFSGRFDANVSYYSNVAYTFKDRYTLSGSARFDQSNLFGVRTNQKGVPLWSVGGSWSVDKEPYYKVTWLPILKLRATYGYNGNLDKSLSAYTTAVYSQSLAGSGLNYASIVNPPNPELRWEKVGIANLGVDFSTQKNIVSGSLEYYRKKGTDLLGYAPVDATAGITSYKGNVADIASQGFDVILNTRNIDKDFKWYSNILFSYATDKVTKYLLQSTSVTNFTADASLTRASDLISPLVGKPVFGIYSYKWAGLDPATGDPMGYLPDGSISKDYAAFAGLKPGDLVYNGPARPCVFGSFRNTFSYKNFSLSANIIYRFGYYFHKPSINYNALLTTWNGSSDYASRWQKTGDEKITNVPSMVYPANTSRDDFYNNSSILVEKGDNIRLQDVNISYALDRASLKRIPFQSLRFYVYANNLGILWRANHSGIDPDYPVLPPQKTLAVGVNATF
ncbi:MAG: SusC/RagA family TonB-linked outer membrane protein [Mucilaginibacter sp.]|uniref:SusC/RagA family TonB-linked outer membrane protein n=1 Tax=Mucilaginibacter sp. TaxID=1882438 RepID=UPI00326449B9